MQRYIPVIFLALFSSGQQAWCSQNLQTEKTLPVLAISGINPHDLSVWLKAFTPTNDTGQEAERQSLCYKLQSALKISPKAAAIKEKLNEKIFSEITTIGCKCVTMSYQNPGEEFFTSVHSQYSDEVNEVEAERKATLEEFSKGPQTLYQLLVLLNAEKAKIPALSEYE